MKIVTKDFGIVEAMPKRLFEHNGIKYAIVSVPYLSNNETFFTAHVYEPEGETDGDYYEDYQLTFVEEY